MNIEPPKTEKAWIEPETKGVLYTVALVRVHDRGLILLC